MSIYTECPSCGGDVVDDGKSKSCLDCGEVVGEAKPRLKTKTTLRDRLTYTIALLLLFGGVGAMIFMIFNPGPNTGEVEGKLVVRGTSLGDMTFTPSECYGAERITGLPRFVGVAFLGSGPDTQMIRIVRKPHHAHAILARDLRRDVVIATRKTAGDPWKELKLTPENCPGLKVKLRRAAGGSTTQRHRERYSGAISATCSLPGGGKVELSIRFAECRCNWHLDKRALR